MSVPKVVTFGEYLASARVRAGLSLRATGAALELSHVFIGEVERGVRRQLAEKHWLPLAALVWVPLEDLSRSSEQTRKVVFDPLSMEPGERRDLVMFLVRRIEDMPVNELRALAGCACVPAGEMSPCQMQEHLRHCRGQAV